MKPKAQTYAVSIWSCQSQMPAACEHVEARAAAAAHGPSYRVQWVKLFEGRKAG